MEALKTRGESFLPQKLLDCESRKFFLSLSLFPLRQIGNIFPGGIRIRRTPILFLLVTTLTLDRGKPSDFAWLRFGFDSYVSCGIAGGVERSRETLCIRKESTEKVSIRSPIRLGSFTLSFHGMSRNLAHDRFPEFGSSFFFLCIHGSVKIPITKQSIGKYKILSYF